MANPSNIPFTRDQGMGAAWAGGWLSKKALRRRSSRSEANSQLTGRQQHRRQIRVLCKLGAQRGQHHGVAARCPIVR
jgi:hypothetical protein